MNNENENLYPYIYIYIMDLALCLAAPLMVVVTGTMRSKYYCAGAYYIITVLYYPISSKEI